MWQLIHLLLQGKKTGNCMLFLFFLSFSFAFSTLSCIIGLAHGVNTQYRQFCLQLVSCTEGLVNIWFHPPSSVTGFVCPCPQLTVSLVAIVCNQSCPQLKLCAAGIVCSQSCLRPALTAGGGKNRARPV